MDLQSMQEMANVLSNAACIAFLIQTSHLSRDDWWDDNMRCNCGECEIERMQPILDVIREAAFLLLDGDEPSESTFADWFVKVSKVYRENTTYFLARNCLNKNPN